MSEPVIRKLPGGFVGVNYPDPPRPFYEVSHELIQRFVDSINFAAGAPSVYTEIAAERERAHDKHGDSSMRSHDHLDPLRLAVLMEEVGEVARVMNEVRHGNSTRCIGYVELRKELIQVAAMAAEWADGIDA